MGIGYARVGCVSRELLLLGRAAGEIDPVVGRHARLPAFGRWVTESLREVAPSDHRDDLLVSARDRFKDDPARIGRLAPFPDPHPLLGFEVLVVREEVL